MTRLFPLALAALLALLAALWLSDNAEPRNRSFERVYGYGQIGFRDRDGRAGGPERWRFRTVVAERRAVRAERLVLRLERQNRRLKRELARRWHDNSMEAIAYASVAYGVDYTMLLRKARCESRLYPYAKNPTSTASGLFQFLTSTWATTPYARFSIWDPYANALAAGWMHANGRGREWVCR